MKNKALVRRYTRGLIQSIQNEEELAGIERQLLDFLEKLRENEDLDLALTSSVLPVSRKVAVAEAVLERMAYLPKTVRFIRILVKNHRLAILEELVGNLPEMWNEENGILSFEVASVIPLSDDQKEKLKEKLEWMEKKPVHLKYKIDSGLIGGLSLRRGNIIYDASLMGALNKLREIISEG